MSAEIEVLVREIEAKALRRLAKLTESENERVALRACAEVLRYARERRREEVSRFEASGERQYPDCAPSASGTPPGGVSPPLAERKKIPHKLLHPTKPKPAFCAVPLDKFAALADLSAPRP